MSKYDEPRCHIDHPDAEHLHRVSNQPDAYDSTRGLSSVWICGGRACTLDARGYVERNSKEAAHVRPAPGHSCDLCEGSPA